MAMVRSRGDVLCPEALRAYQGVARRLTRMTSFDVNAIAKAMTSCGALWALQGCMLFSPPQICAEREDECALSALNGNGLDDDCDGVVDEGCACEYLERERGVCPRGVIGTGAQRCVEPRGYIAEETSAHCDGLDNDCDGVIDEACACDARGKPGGVCSLGRLNDRGLCDEPALFAETESLCDGYDNDCDGAVDEACPTCNFKDKLFGVCASGRREVDGACLEPLNWAEVEDECSSDALAGDGVDNDCDGVVDEGCACDYGEVKQGVCRGGVIRAGGEGGGECGLPPAFAPEEIALCDGLDNDCDGEIDEGCEQLGQEEL